MLTRKSDSILLGVAFTLIISSIILLYSRTSLNQTGDIIGKMIDSSLQVRSRLSQSLTWKDLKGGASVLDEQYIFTGDMAQAKIQLSNGSLLEISERTLFKLQDPSRSIVTIEKGIIRAKVTEGTPLELSVDGKRISISSSDAQVTVNINKGQNEIGVSSGTADLMIDNQKKSISEKELIHFDDKKDSEIKIIEKITLVNPFDNQKFHHSLKKQMVKFNWISSQKSKIEISKDASFNKIIHSAMASQDYKYQLGNGHYYWRVVSGDARSHVGEFNLIQETPPEIRSPKNGDVLKVVEFGLDEFILLDWEEIDGPFDLETKLEGKTIVHNNIYPPFKYKVDQSQNLEWRVKKNIVGRDQTQWSSWQKIKLDFIKKPKVVTNLSPVSFEQITYGESPRSVLMKWDEQIGPYTIEVKSEQSLETINSVQNNYEYILKNPGEYSWRVRVKDQYDRESEFSEWQYFSWKDESANIAKTAQKIVLKRPSQKVSFSWEKTGADEVLFELASDQYFNTVIIKKNLKSDSTDVTFPDQGTYFWRTQKITESGEKILTPPKKVIIEPAPAPEKPASLPEVEVPLEYIETTFVPSFFDLIISSAVADDIKLVAPLHWPAKDEAEYYLIEIYNDKNLQNKIHEIKTKETNYRWENVKVGEYYWRWAVIDYWGRVSPFSDISALKVVPPENFKIEKVKLITPIRKTELVQPDSISFQWTEVKTTDDYSFEVATDDDFDEGDIIYQTKTKSAHHSISKKWELGNYYWRVITRKWDQSKISSTGRFVVIEPEIVKEVKTQKTIKEIIFKLPEHLAIVSWAPSMESLNFETKDAKADISGNVLFGIKGEYRRKISDKWNGELSILHQSGKVFDKENYKQRHIKIGANYQLGEKLSLAPSLGLFEYQEYSKNNNKLIGKDQRTFDLGAELRYQLNFKESSYELYGELRGGGVLSYALGVRRFTSVWTQALIIQARQFGGDDFDASQTSIRLELGRLFSFD